MLPSDGICGGLKNGSPIVRSWLSTVAINGRSFSKAHGILSYCYSLNQLWDHGATAEVIEFSDGTIGW